MSPVRSQPSAVRTRLGRLGIVEVAGEHVRPAHPQLPGVADEDVVAVLVDDAQLDAVEHGADRAVPRRQPGRRRDDRRRLGEPVALGDDEPEPSLQRSATVDGQLGGPGEATRIVAKESAGASSNWLNATHIGGAPNNTVTPRSAIDSIAVAGSKRCTSSSVAPDEQRLAEDDVEPVHVVQRDHAVGDVARRDVLAARAGLVEVGPHAAVGEHRRLRGAGRAAREQQGGEVVGLDVDHRRRVRGHHLGGGDGAGDLGAVGGDHRAQRRNRGPVDVAPWRRPGAVDDGARRPRRCRSGGPARAAGLVGLSGTATAPMPSSGQVGDDERHAVAAHDGDPIAVGDPVGEEPAAGAGDQVGQLGVRRRPVAADDRDAVTVVPVDDLGQVHRHPRCLRASADDIGRPKI